MSATFQLHGATNETAEMIDGLPDVMAREVMEHLIRHMVGQTIFCPITESLLDYRTSVVITVLDPAGDTKSLAVVHEDAWEAQGRILVDAATAEDCTVKVSHWSLVPNVNPTQPKENN